jgi:hypothetical protein
VFFPVLMYDLEQSCIFFTFGIHVGKFEYQVKICPSKSRIPEIVDGCQLAVSLISTRLFEIKISHLIFMRFLCCPRR